MKIILFGFDGLRADMVNHSSMPHLASFLESNVWYSDVRSVFPAETYVNHPSIFTGFLPERHGMVANAFFDAAVSRKDFFLGSLVERIEEAEKRTSGALFQVPTLTENLAAHGLKYFSISSNSPGSTRLMAHKAPSIGGVNISVNGIAHACPESLRGKYGPDSEEPLVKPDLKGLRKMNQIVHDLVREDGLPDVGIIWYGEPDHSFHAFGLDAPESSECLRSADECFAEIVEAYGKNDDVQIIVVSDHGHITIREHFDLIAALENAGFRHGESLESPSADFTLLWGYSGNIYLRNQNRLEDFCEALRAMDEVGMLFTRDRNGRDGLASGTFSSRLVGGDHARAGDIRFILRAFDEKGPGGYPGICVCAASMLDVGCGIHGGLHPGELRTVLGFGGSAFKKSRIVENPAGVIDIAPTIYRLLKIKPALNPQGRILKEALMGEPSTHPEAEKEIFRCGNARFSQELSIDYIAGIPYIDRGGRV